MKIWFLTQWFDPEPMLRDSLYIRTLQEQGHDIEVITGFPNYPGGKLYPGYRLRLFQQEVINGVKVIRLPLYPSHDTSALRRILTYSSFAFCVGIYTLFKANKPDLLVAYALPPLGMAAAWVSRLRKVPFIFEIHDLWPDSLASTQFVKQSRLLKLASGMCHFVYRHASKILVSSPGYQKKLIERGVPANKLKLIYNFCNEEIILNPAPIDLSIFGLADYFTIVYAGAMGRPQNLQSVLLAAEKVVTVDPKIKFIFIGEGIEKKDLQKIAADRRIKNVVFFDAVPAAQIGAILAVADVLLVHLKGDPLFDLSIPSKTQANLAVGKPILMAVKGEAAKLISEIKAGICVNPDQPEELAEAVIKLAQLDKVTLEKMGQNGKSFYWKNFSFRKNIELYDHLLKEAVQEGT